jgi:hypothetical protein
MRPRLEEKGRGKGLPLPRMRERILAPAPAAYFRCSGFSHQGQRDVFVATRSNYLLVWLFIAERLVGFFVAG